jgi:hypothetical protein
MKYLIVLLVISMLIGCSYATRFQVGEYGASHTASVTKHGLE